MTKTIYSNCVEKKKHALLYVYVSIGVLIILSNLFFIFKPKFQSSSATSSKAGFALIVNKANQEYVEVRELLIVNKSDSNDSRLSIATRLEPKELVQQQITPLLYIDMINNIDQGKFTRLHSDFYFKTELYCLTEAIYFEARSESESGQRAVAEVIINRAKSDKFLNSICNTVNQKQMGVGCQFSYLCENKKHYIVDKRSWQKIYKLAFNTIMDSYSFTTKAKPSLQNKATYYHAVYVKPMWSKKMTRAKRIGNHIFYVDSKVKSPSGVLLPEYELAFLARSKASPIY